MGLSGIKASLAGRLAEAKKLSRILNSGAGRRIPARCNGSRLSPRLLARRHIQKLARVRFLEGRH